MDLALAKLDSALRDVLTSAPAATRLEVLVRVVGAAGDMRSELLHAGVEVHSISGPIATGVLVVARVRGVAELPWVRRIELTRALFPEASRG